MSADDQTKRDYRDTIFLPKTDFPMRAGLPQREPEFLKKWQKEDIYKTLRKDSAGREKFILHDGPPYANGDIHFGHAMQKTLKDIIVKSQQMLGKDAPFVPGWDCHGLPIEWKIEEKYRKKKKNKDDVDPVEFRRECREFADHWVGIQREQFKRLGIFGDWDNPYTTMSFDAEATIVTELLKFAGDGSLYRGSKPVMWSPVEKTALAEAEVEYHDHTSTQIDVAFPIVSAGNDLLKGASVVIWTTTPWTIPANRAVCFGPDIDYVLIETQSVTEDAVQSAGRLILVADALLNEFANRAGITEFTVKERFKGEICEGAILAHPWRGHTDADGFYDFDVPMLPGDHVTTEAGTGFVHTAPGHGDDDYQVAHVKFDIPVPYTVNEAGCYYEDIALVAGHHVYKVADTVCDLLTGVGALVAKGTLTHSYPHSWRSKAPLIFRNTPQWFISMEKNGLRDTAMKAIGETNWYPAVSKNRISSMVQDRPDWVISRQRAWGVPITIFVHKTTGEILVDPAVNDRIVKAVTEQGADAWLSMSTSDFLGDAYNADDYEQVQDILDVWFDSGCTHAFVLEKREELSWPADLYIEGSDQHRGWFQSSLLESCGTRGRAPYKDVMTHGMALDGEGRKMSKSGNNAISPEVIVKQYGADILRLWVAAVDYKDDVRISDQIIQGQVDAYRKIRNTLRYMLGNLSGFDDAERLPAAEMPELDQYILHRLSELDAMLRERSKEYDFNPVFRELYQFCIGDLSAFYFDIRKDSLYCDDPTDTRRRAARTVLDAVFNRLVVWFAPILSFTSEEVWQSRFGAEAPSVHREVWPETPTDWRDDSLATKWGQVRKVRSVVTSALELMRRDKVIGSSLQANADIYVDNTNGIADLDWAEITITSSAKLLTSKAPDDAFTLDSVAGVAVKATVASGEKCERCWVISAEVSQNDGLCNRCKDAVAAHDAKAA
jgi:isoleucyl-tRNA synthetase